MVRAFVHPQFPGTGDPQPISEREQVRLTGPCRSSRRPKSGMRLHKAHYGIDVEFQALLECVGRHHVTFEYD